MIVSLYAGLSEFALPAAQEGDAAVLADKARWAALTADVPASGISDNLAGGNLTDGYRLHDFRVDNASAQDQSFQTLQISRTAEVASANSSNLAVAGILPSIELDFSSEAAVAPTVASAANSGRSAVA